MIPLMWQSIVFGLNSIRMVTPSVDGLASTITIFALLKSTKGDTLKEEKTVILEGYDERVQTQHARDFRIKRND